MEGAGVSDRRTYRKFTAEQKLEIVLAGLRSGNVAEAYRSHQISSSLYYGWRDHVWRPVDPSSPARSFGPRDSGPRPAAAHPSSLSRTKCAPLGARGVACTGWLA